MHRKCVGADLFRLGAYPHRRRLPRRFEPNLRHCHEEHFKNKGRAYQEPRSFGSPQHRARQSPGEYITFLDSDDILHPLFLELMMNKIMRYKAEIVACEIKKFADGFDSYSSIAMRLGFDSYVEKMSCQCYAGSEITRKALYQRIINCSACGKLFSRRL